MEFALYLVLSVLIVFKNPTLFLSFALALALLRLKTFAKSFRNAKLGEKAYGICMHLVWVVYILSFATLLGLSYYAEGRSMDQREL